MWFFFLLDILTLLPEAAYRRPCPNFPIKMTSTFHIPITLKDLRKMPIKPNYSVHHLLTNILHVFLIIEWDFQKSEWFSTWSLSKHINLCYLYTCSKNKIWGQSCKKNTHSGFSVGWAQFSVRPLILRVTLGKLANLFDSPFPDL